jgi:hypothetical protein
MTTKRFEDYAHRVIRYVIDQLDIGAEGSIIQGARRNQSKGSAWIELMADGISFEHRDFGPRRSLTLAIDFVEGFATLDNELYDESHMATGNFNLEGDVTPLWYINPTARWRRAKNVKVFGEQLLALIRTCGIWHLDQEQGTKEKCKTCPYQLSCLSQTPI